MCEDIHSLYAVFRVFLCLRSIGTMAFEIKKRLRGINLPSA